MHCFYDTLIPVTATFQKECFLNAIKKIRSNFVTGSKDNTQSTLTFLLPSF